MMVFSVELLNAEAHPDPIPPVLVQFYQSPFFMNVRIQRESGSDPQIWSSADGTTRYPVQ